MEQKKLERINTLTALSRERELTAEEKAEREALRKEYIAEWRRSTIAVLENTRIVTPDGKKHKLPKRKKKNGQNRQNSRGGRTPRLFLPFSGRKWRIMC